MKATELMIGDWVLAYGKKTQIVWVGNIHKMAVRGFPYEFMDGEIEPIPLTPGILETNGFEKRGTRTHYYHKDDYYDLELDEYSDGIWIATYISRDLSLPPEQLSMSYVHELQHFLRFCAIKKDIEL